jgi:Polysaccharide lyase
MKMKSIVLLASLALAAHASYATVYFQDTGKKENWPNYPQTPQANGTISDVSSPAYKNGTAIKFTQTFITSGYTGRYHSEVDYQGTQVTGQTRYYGLALYLPSNWSTNDSKAAFQQWAGDGPWIIMEVRGTNVVILPHIAGITTIAPITRGAWMRVVTQLTDSSSGTLAVWINGSKKITLNGNLVAPATNGEVRWSAGLYVTGWYPKPSSTPNPSYRELYEDHYRITSSYAEAEPANW